jgi:alkylhydroperoxidase family enzyme
VLDDYTTAPIDAKLRATLAFLAKLTLQPDDVGKADAQAVLATGVTPRALEEAIRVAYVFNIFDRLADSLGFRMSTPEGFRASAKFLLKHGYKT